MAPGAAREYSSPSGARDIPGDLRRPHSSIRRRPPTGIHRREMTTSG
jgi:hypothetical protein